MPNNPYNVKVLNYRTSSEFLPLTKIKVRKAQEEGLLSEKRGWKESHMGLNIRVVKILIKSLFFQVGTLTTICLNFLLQTRLTTHPLLTMGKGVLNLKALILLLIDYHNKTTAINQSLLTTCLP